MEKKYAWKERELVKKPTSRNKAKKKELSEEKKQYMREYYKKQYRTINLKFNVAKEKEMIEWLDSQESLKGYLLDLLKKEMLLQKRKV